MVDLLNDLYYAAFNEIQEFQSEDPVPTLEEVEARRSKFEERLYTTALPRGKEPAFLLLSRLGVAEKKIDELNVIIGHLIAENDELKSKLIELEHN